MTIVYITKYALTTGIMKRDAEISDSIASFKDDGCFRSMFHGKDWHLTEAVAIKRAEEMRTKKLASIAKQAVKLNAIDFNVMKG